MNMLRKTMCAVALGATTLAPIMSTTVFAAPVAASEQQATANLVKQLNGIKSFTANFEQTTKVSNNGKALPNRGLSAQHMNQTFKGVMKVERPGKFFWETTNPPSASVGRRWTQQLLQAIDTHGKDLVEQRSLGDKRNWCPNYSRLSKSDRREFWAHLMVAVS